MRFHMGAFPHDKTFDPQAEGWSALPETDLNSRHLATFLAAVGLFMLWLLLLLASSAELFIPRTTQLSDRVFRVELPILPFETPLWPLLAILITIFVLLSPVHEFLHALCCPDWGLSSKTVFGIWPARGVFYIHHEGPMQRNRFLLVLVFPYIVLGLVPLVLMAVFRVSG